MTPFIHQTDIFHPHGDPDDHWDLATVYALAQQGLLDLRGFMLDYPPKHRVGDPATLAIAQLDCISGITGVPVMIGSMNPVRDRAVIPGEKDDKNFAAAKWLCQVLQNSPEPIVINIVGSCTDVAIAGLMRPDLFKSKCKAVYLNAGAANPGTAGELEYNVRLNPSSYASVFDLPCPIYWCPCWHQTEQRQVGVNGTWYSFVQNDVFATINDPLCNYFLYMLSRSADPKYLRYLNQPTDAALKAEFGQKTRSMWSTAAILHAAGMGVDAVGGLMPNDQITQPVFEFIPVSLTCADDGQTTWRPTDPNTGRYIFQLRRPDLYQTAMTTALSNLLSKFSNS